MISLHEGKGSPIKKAPERVIALRLTVGECHPRIWRRLLVRESMWLSRFHDTIQVLFEWFDYQTHVFNLDDLRFGNPVKSEHLVIEDDRDVTLSDIDIATRDRFTYLYNFGEAWRIDIKVEKVGERTKGMQYPLCLLGERAGPPEDCGGVEAFHDMLACLKDPESDLGREWREWVGPSYDPAACDIGKINATLRRLGK